MGPSARASARAATSSGRARSVYRTSPQTLPFRVNERRRDPWRSPTPEDGMTEPTTVDEYMATFPEDRRAVLEQLRETIRTAAPEATETIAYDMPAFRTARGDFLVSFAAYQRHYSLFPASDDVVRSLGAEIAPYVAGKGTIRFPAGKPIPLGLVAKVVAIRVTETGARSRK